MILYVLLVLCALLENLCRPPFILPLPCRKLFSLKMFRSATTYDKFAFLKNGLAADAIWEQVGNLQSYQVRFAENFAVHVCNEINL